jgi:hypothetical protein
VASLQYFRNGILQKRGADYSVVGGRLTIIHSLSVPGAGDLLQAFYRY